MNPIPVVIAIIENSQRQLLISQRQAHQSCPGMWEFPGGKVEPGETLEAALSREIAEELSLTVVEPKYVFNFPYHYPPDLDVDLHIYHVTQFSGKAHGAEGQTIHWSAINDLTNYEFPAANQAIIQWVKKIVISE